jgi:hypothetical protein
MCTVTLRCGGGSLLLTMNRDERHERAPEQPPRAIHGESGRPGWAAPFDGASGGTWIGVNERGVAACLLNGYSPAEADLAGRRDVPSRGSIIPRILEDRHEGGPARLGHVLDFSAYPSFTLLVASEHGGEILKWRHGGTIEREPVGTGWTFLTSSSWNEPDVAAWRRRAFEAWLAAGAATEHGVPAIHVFAPKGEERRAPLMTRERSATRSIAQVRVGAGNAELVWWPRREASGVDLTTPGGAIALRIVRDPGGEGGEERA